MTADGDGWRATEKEQTVLVPNEVETEESSLARNLASLSEEELTTDFVIPLLKAMGYRDVRYVHGQLEHGVDVLFSEQTPLGPEFCAAQVKAVKIDSGKTGRPGTIVEIINQASAAFRHKFLDVSDNVEKTIDKFVVITSNRFTEVAQLEMRDALLDFGRTLRFIDGVGLSDLLERHLGPYSREYFGRRNMMADLAHWLRGPLTGIFASISHLRELVKRSQAVAPKATDVIENAVAHAQDLASKIETALLVLTPKGRLERPFLMQAKVDRLIRELAASYEHRARERGLHFELQLCEAAPVPVDVQAMKLALSNVIDNAVKYSAGRTEVVIRTRDDGSQVLVEIEDTGLLIPAHELPRIWEPYFRGSEVRAGLMFSTGAGLGLTVTKRIVEMHGGKVDAFSNLLSDGGSGLAITRFTLLLPRSKAEGSR